MATIVAVRLYLRQICHPRFGSKADACSRTFSQPMMSALYTRCFPFMTGLSSPLTRGFAIALLWLFFVPGTVLAQDVSVERVFAAVPIDQWIKAGPQAPIPWKVRVQSYGLSLHQRLLAHIDVELAGKELVKHPQGDRLVALVQVNDAGGHLFRDYSYVSLQEIP